MSVTSNMEKLIPIVLIFSGLIRLIIDGNLGESKKLIIPNRGIATILIVIRFVCSD
jgi:hypothetical protein